MQESDRGGRIKESLEKEEGRSILEVGIQSSGFEEATVEGCFPRSRWWEEGEEEEEEERSRGVRAMRLHASPERSYKLRNIDLNKEPPPWDTDDVSGGATGSGGGGDTTIAFRGVRHRPELNKWVTEIRPTSQKRKIWLGTYETPQEAARAYDAGIFYTKKKIPYNFEDSPHHLHNQPIPPELPWDAFAALVKQKATLAAKRHRVNNLQEFATAQ